tara:strand:+ start:746 stop:1036 length:291 start_codon:yes stop_codon:yes gene_type:complete
MKKIILTTIVTISSMLGYSRDGRVVDTKGEPLPCATITVPSQNLTVYADFDGFYEIDVAEGTEIVVSYISHKSKTTSVEDGMVVTLQDINIDNLIK